MLAVLRFAIRLAAVVAALLALLYISQLLLERDREIPDDLGQPPTKAPSIVDLLERDIPAPVRQKVSFPHFTYQQAFPEATDEPELVINSFSDAPMLHDPEKMPEAFAEHFTPELPPVAERLPRNPAVVRGPDGIGVYGGTWHRCTTSFNDINTKIGYESFIRFGPKGQIQPALAYKWEVANNNRVFTFYLRKGHRWSDGHPFTTEDILWVLNTLIGSPRWSTEPNWMQPTDGTARIIADDVLDWSALATRVMAEADSSADTPGSQLLGVGGEPMRDLLKKIAMGEANESTRTKFIDALNGAMQKQKDGNFFDPAAWDGIDLKAELAGLHERGASRLTADQMKRLELLTERASLAERFEKDPTDLSAIETSRLNVLAFRAAYPELVDVARHRRVKVEAVPDETGDTSHIVRFTFPKPNAIFLEKTATFMFYRGIFETPKHIDAPLHRDGSDRFAATDVQDWAAFNAKLREGRADANSPAGRLWSRLDDNVKPLFETSNDLDEAQQRRAIEAINRVLADRTFYDEAAWSDFDTDAELAEMMAKGYTKLNGVADHHRVKELWVRADLLKRVKQDGIDSLSDHEAYLLNQAMLRVAFDNGATQGAPIALNREAGLNYAAQNRPNKYTSWVTRSRALSGTFDRDYNRHPPTLRAWRPITERDDRTQIAVRNPYYYRVDPAGNQLPYLNAIETQVEADTQVRLQKLLAGSVDFQVRQIEFSDFSLLKRAEMDQRRQEAEWTKRGGPLTEDEKKLKAALFEIRLWPQDYCGEVTFLPVQAHADPEYAKIQEDPRFRHALSLALNRQQMIDVVFAGIGEPAQYSVPEGSPYYSVKHHHAYTAYDVDRANQLLDEMGLKQRNSENVRLLPSGKPLTMDVNTVTERPLPLVQMACNYWRKIGIDAQMKLRAGGTIARMAQMGRMDIIVHKEGGNYFGPILAGGYAPTHPAEAMQWSKWVQYIHTGGLSGWEPPAHMRETERLWERVITAPNDKAKYRAWQVLSDRIADRLPIIGVTTSPGKVVYVKRNFKNVPQVALAGWIAHEPGNCCPEAFFKEPTE